MSLHAGTHAAYGAAARALGTPRSLEYQLFGRVTGRLKSAQRDGDFPELAAALHQNLQLWTALAADLADPENRLPADLKRRLMSLALFARNHTPKVLQGEAEPTVLVEINTAIMAGLRGEPGEDGGA